MLNRPSREAPETAAGAAPLRLADPASAQLSVLDLAATRGDGIFESISLINGIPHAIEAHLARFMTSARLLDLPEPDLGTWRDAIELARTTMDDQPEASIKAVMSRGIEGGDCPTGWVFAAPTPDFSDVRTAGVRVVLLDRGYRHNVDTTSPWLLTGAKTLSYALNRAALREAHRRDADDVVFVSSDGFALEGPTSSLIVLHGAMLLTPGAPGGAGLGILEGTTQGDIFGWASGVGLATQSRLVSVDDLTGSDAAWLVSSSRHAVPIRAIDGRPHPVDAVITERINTFLLTRTS